MTIRALGLALVVAGSLAAAEPLPTASGENENLRIEATLYTDAREIQSLLGVEMEKGVAVVAVSITPKKVPLKIWHEDFILRSDKDGQKSEPYDPGQIASNSVLTLVYSYDGGGAVAQQDQGPVWGGMGGEMPRRLPGQAGGVGNTAGVERASDTRVDDNPDKADNPLLKTLRAKILAEDAIEGPVQGLLYYPLSGKHKPRQIWLHYRGEHGKIDLQFKKP